MNRFALERTLLREGYDGVIGCDEVGRGCLAGPVVAAAVVFAEPVRQSWWNQVRDSKLVKREERDELAALIREHALSWGIGVVTPSVIDRINIHQATLRAMKHAVNQLLRKTNWQDYIVAVDGKFIIPKLELEQRAIVDGDALVHSVAAASIVAKSYRDSLMERLHKKYPLYNFAQHKGYGTVQHRQALQDHGLSPVHRVSFCGKMV